MGNQIAHTPNQILNVETYFNDLSEYAYVKNLGVTRFLKVAKAKNRYGYSVIKIFQIVDHSLPYDQYKAQIQEIYSILHEKELSPSPLKNCLPFQIVTKNDRSIILSRPYIKDNLFYRLQTRPYLTRIEKKWIAFQLLIALKHIHNVNIAHGDLKIENILLTSYNWILLSDFANFKPTYFAYEDPAEYYYYFNASQRNVCYLAPERFYDQTRIKNDINNDTFSTSFGKLGTPSMDIFSLGCILAELFTEQPLFTLSQMLDYRNNGYDPMPIVNKIADVDIRAMVASMINRDPSKRHTADEYLDEQTGKAFPSCFYTFLLPYVQKILKEFSPDFVIYKLHRDFSYIMNSLLMKNNNNNINENQMEVEEENKHETSQCLLILLSLALSSMRKLKHLHSRLVALELLRLMIPLVNDQIILDRILPYVNVMLHDNYHRVRADAIRTLVFAISSVKNINQENADLFSEYLFPTLSTASIQDDCYVRSNLAKYLSILAEHSLRFLEKTYLIEERNDTVNNDYFKLYEEELKSVQTWMQGKFGDLIHGDNDDQNGQLAEAVCRSDLIRLCTFFGKRKTIEVICGHLTTLLGQSNWRLRATLFDSLVTVVAYIGLESEVFIESLLNQGLIDEEEFVVYRVLKALACFVRLSLLKRTLIYQYLRQVAPLVCHPNLWLRLGVIEYVSSICEKSHLADVHAFVLPVIEQYFKFPIIQVGNPDILYNALIDPLSRELFEYVQKIQPNENLFRHLSDRSNIRQLTGTGLKPAYTEPTDSVVRDAFDKLTELGMKEEDENKILALKFFFKQTSQYKLNISATTETTTRPGIINIKIPPGRRYDLISSLNRNNNDNYSTRNLPNDSDWSEMFGTVPMQVPNQQENIPPNSISNPNDRTINENPEETTPMETVQYQLPSTENIAQHRHRYFHESSSNAIRTGLQLQCLMERNNLLAKHEAIYREDCQREKLLKHSVPTNVFEISDQKLWTPQGTLLGHIHLHNGKITKLASSLVSPSATYYTQLFATGDSKGAIRLWDINQFQKSLIFRPSRAIRGPASPVRGLAFTSENNLNLASLNENGQLNIFDLNSPTTDIREPFYNLKLDVTDVGVPIDLKYFNTGSQDILALATSQGLIVGIDTRCSTPIFRFKNDLNHRLITAFEVDELQSWLAVGTGSGYIDIWDMRFQLCIQGMRHPTGARVISLLRHQDQPSSLISSFQGNNEVAIWNIDKPQTRQKVFWPSCATPLSLTQSLHHYIAAMYLWKNDASTSLLCAGTDMRIRNWNLTQPFRSYIVCRGAADDDVLTVRYQSKKIEGVEVTVEEYHRRKHTSSPPTSTMATNSSAPPTSTPAEIKTTKSSVNIPPAHTDTVTSMQLMMSKDRIPYLVTVSSDAVIKIWK
jgi:phosphoinositide-3-kinase regulatory subunit 4